MRYRQVHLDFHTSEAIDGIGADFKKEEFQAALKAGHVDSITIFSKCHHGWAYHPSKANKMHPGLKFDLLGAQIEAAHEIGVKTPVYLSGGFDEKLYAMHPEWGIRSKNPVDHPSVFHPGYHMLCMNTPYLDILLSQVEEVVRNYDCDGIFIDIVGVRKCYCPACMKQLIAEGKDPQDDAAVEELGRRTYLNYTKRINELVHSIKPGLPVFHNGGHIIKGDRELAYQNTHLELESLPTGGWGYDHFPASVRYSANLGQEYLGMTGKFHKSWGEFGGFKHKNALRYEVALSLMNGAASSVGDQLHPRGKMDMATYELIGAAYSESEQKEPWCRDTKYIADIGLFSQEAADTSSISVNNGFKGDTGAVRCFSEAQLMFDILDIQSDFSKYKLIVLPDTVRLGGELEKKIKEYIKAGGKILATGTSGLKEDKDEFAIDLGVTFKGACEFNPTYLHPLFKTDYLSDTSYIVYSDAYEIEADKNVIAERHNPYFNRTYLHFCSHQHAPADTSVAFPAVVCGEKTAYIGWNIFADYTEHASLVARETIVYIIKKLLGDDITFKSNIPAQGIASVTEGKDFYVTHLLYGSPVKRGEGICVIEDLLPLHNVEVSLKLREKISRATLVPQMKEIPFEYKDGRVCFTVPEMECHQMIELHK